MFLLILCVIYLPVVASTDNQYSALHFGTSTSDHITFKYDMAPFQDSLSICTWIKRLHTSSSQPLVLEYYIADASGHEILISSNGYFNRVLDDTGLERRQDLFTVPVGTWFSYCITWSVASRTIKLYLDGDLVATDQTPSGRRLRMGGQLWFGGHHTGGYSHHVFGGDLYQFNVYSNVLESAEIKKIADGGLCFDLEEFSDTRILRWEDILDRSRSGSVSEVEACTTKELITLLRERLANMTGRLNGTEAQLSKSEEKVETLVNLLNSTQEELESSQLNFTEAKKQLNVTKEKLVTTEEELKGVTADMNRTETALKTVTGDLNSTQAELGAVSDDLETCSADLKDIESKFKESRTFQNVTRWDVLLTPPYFNKVFSNELFQQLTTSWNMLGK